MCTLFVLCGVLLLFLGLVGFVTLCRVSGSIRSLEHPKMIFGCFGIEMVIFGLSLELGWPLIAA